MKKTNYFVIDWKRYGGADAFKNIVGHALRQRHYKNRGNIDERRSKENIVLHDYAGSVSWREYVQECNDLARLSGGRSLRKGAKDFFAIVVDSSVIPSWKEEDYIRYLKDAEKWLKKRFSGQKLLYSVIHRDEKKPHLHIAFSYFNEDRQRWSQKWLKEQKLDRLNELLKDFEKEVGSKYGLKKGKSMEEKAKKTITKAMNNLRKEERGILWWKKTEFKFDGFRKGTLQKIGKALITMEDWEKNKPATQHTAHVAELNQKIEQLREETHTIRQELRKTQKELSTAKEKLREKDRELQRYKEDAEHLHTLIKIAGSLHELESAAIRHGNRKLFQTPDISNTPDIPKK